MGGDARATEREPGHRWGKRHAGFVAADAGRGRFGLSKCGEGTGVDAHEML